MAVLCIKFSAPRLYTINIQLFIICISQAAFQFLFFKSRLGLFLALHIDQLMVVRHISESICNDTYHYAHSKLVILSKDST